MAEPVVIVGAGQAGAEVATALRQRGHAGPVVIVGDELQVPYRRPPLSKAFLAGKASVESLFLKPATAYAGAGIDLRLGAHAECIDRKSRRLLLSGGESLPYAKLVLATGGRARRLAVPGADAANVSVVRTIADVERLRAMFAPGRRLVVIGGGYIGLEVAAVAIETGLQVTLIEAMPSLLARVASPELADFYEAAHRDKGVDVRTGAAVARLDTAGGLATAVVCGDGSSVPVDLVVVGIGLAPNVELAQAAGLDITNGIAVDAFCSTSDPNILAAGDSAEHPNEFLGRRVRLESVQNAMEQGRAAAATIAGVPQAYRPVPWFWSDQYDLKLQMVGMPGNHDRIVVRGDVGARSFAFCYLRDGAVIAVDSVNRAPEFMLARQLVARGGRVDAARLADPAVPLKSLLEG